MFYLLYKFYGYEVNQARHENPTEHKMYFRWKQPGYFSATRLEPHLERCVRSWAAQTLLVSPASRYLSEGGVTRTRIHPRARIDGHRRWKIGQKSRSKIVESHTISVILGNQR